MSDLGTVQISLFHVMVRAQLLQTGGCFAASGSDAVKPVSLTLIKSYFSEHKIFLHQLLKGKPRDTEYFMKLICVATCDIISTHITSEISRRHLT